MENLKEVETVITNKINRGEFRTIIDVSLFIIPNSPVTAGKAPEGLDFITRSRREKLEGMGIEWNPDEELVQVWFHSADPNDHESNFTDHGWSEELAERTGQQFAPTYMPARLLHEGVPFVTAKGIRVTPSQKGKRYCQLGSIDQIIEKLAPAYAMQKAYEDNGFKL